MYSPNGTRRTFSYRAISAPVESHAICELWKWCSPAPSITPAVRGAPRLPRERGEVGAFGRVADGPLDVHRVLGPHHEIDGCLHAVGRGEVALEDETLVGRARVGSLRAAALHERDVHRTDVVTTGRDGREADHERDRGGTDRDRRPGPFPRGRQGDPDDHHEHDEQRCATDPHDERDRRDGLADREGSERHAAERP